MDALDEAEVKVNQAPEPEARNHGALNDLRMVRENRSRDSAAAGAQTNPELHTVVIALDTNKFPVATGRQFDLRSLLELLRKSGVQLEPPRSIFYTRSIHSLQVHATRQELDTIKRAIAALAVSPVQPETSAVFIELQEWLR